jgi:predicted outer membrane repeat protein
MVNNGASPTMGNVTFFGNSAVYAGAMYNVATSGDSSGVTLINATFSANSANSGGAIYNDSNNFSGVLDLLLFNVILWGDTGTYPEIGNDTAFEEVEIHHSVVDGGCGPIAASGGIVTCDGTDLTTNPNLDPGGLASNGGFSKTLALMTGSSAIDNGDDGFCGPLPVGGFDQRGMPRPQGPHCDIGAYEKELPAPSVIGLFPADGGSSCRRPDVGAGLLLSNLTRLNGSFNPAVVMLMLDGVNVTGLASKAQTMSSPASEGSVLYRPTSDLGLGLHWASFTYPTAGGQATLQWSFTVTSAACPVAGTHGPVEALGPVDENGTSTHEDAGAATGDPVGGNEAQP